MSKRDQEHDEYVINNLPTPEHIPESDTEINPAYQPIPQRKLSALDSAILALKRTHPDLTAAQIGKALKKHGLSSSVVSIYTRLRESELLRMEFSALEKYRREQLVRDEYPLARKKLRKILKNRDDKVPAAVEMQAVKLVYDKVHADRQDKSIESPVNIQNIERLQILVQKAITD